MEHYLCAKRQNFLGLELRPVRARYLAMTYYSGKLIQADGIKQSSFLVAIFWVITTWKLTLFFRHFWGRCCFLLAQNLSLLVLSWLCLGTFLAQFFYNRSICFSKSFQCLPKPIQSPWRRRQHIHPKLRREALYLRRCNLAKTVTGTRHAVQDWEYVFTVWSCQFRLRCWSTGTVWVPSD